MTCSRSSRLADVDIQLEQFPVNPRCAPERILAAHCTNQRSNFLGHSGAPRLSPSNFPMPEQAEAPAVPTNHRRGFDNGDGRLPFPPNRRQPRPEQPIRSCQLRSLHRPLQNSELMTKGKNLKLKGRATAKESQEGRPQRYKWRRISKSKVVRQASMYQQLRVCENHRQPKAASPDFRTSSGFFYPQTGPLPPGSGNQLSTHVHYRALAAAMYSAALPIQLE